MSRCMETDNFFVSTGPNHLQLTDKEPVETEVLDSWVNEFFPTCGQRAGFEKTLEFNILSNNAFVLLNSIKLDLSLRVLHKDRTECHESKPEVAGVEGTLSENGRVGYVAHQDAVERPSRVVLLNSIAHTLWQDIVSDVSNSTLKV